jgi:hypothetical protein
MFEVHLFIPLADNEARAFTESHHSQFEQAILDRFGGLSLLPGSVAGQWQGQVRIQSDQLRVYSVAVSSIIQGHLIGELVAIAKVHYRQQAIYIRYLGQAEIL